MAGTVILAIIKGWPAIVDASLRARMALGDRRLSRIEKLEAEQKSQRASYEAELGIVRHELANITTAFEALLLMIEAKPEAAADHVARIRELRERQQAKSSVEKATIRAAQIMSAGNVAHETGQAT